MSTKVSRRKMVKLMAAAGAALAASPYLAKVSAFAQQSNTSRPASAGNAAQAPSSGEPLVLLVKGDQVTGYRGLEEMPLRDASLASMLNSAFASRLAGA